MTPEVTDKDALYTMDALGVIKLGDMVQLDIREDIPWVSRYGMDLAHHGAWGRVERIDPIHWNYYVEVENRIDRNRYAGCPRLHFHYHTLGYGFTILNIMGWKREEKA